MTELDIEAYRFEKKLKTCAKIAMGKNDDWNLNIVIDKINHHEVQLSVYHSKDKKKSFVLTITNEQWVDALKGNL